MKTLTRLLLCAAPFYTATLPNIAAAEPLIVNMDESRIVSVSRPPGTVIVGNPSIADVTMHGEKVLVHARGYGSTNIILLDDNGNHIADYTVTVQSMPDNTVQVYKAAGAAAQYTYSCAPDCEATLHVGDNPGWFGDVAKMQTKKSGIALGQKEGETSASPEGQPPPQ